MMNSHAADRNKVPVMTSWGIDSIRNGTAKNLSNPLTGRSRGVVTVICWLHCALSCGTVYCNQSCLCLWLGESLCHDNSKLRASILTRLGLYLKVVTVSSWLNFGRPVPPGRASAAGENFWFHLSTASAQCLRLSEHFFSLFICRYRTKYCYHAVISCI